MRNDYVQLTAKPAQVAEMLGYSDTKTVYGLIRSGKIRARKVGNTYLVNLTSVRRFAGEE
ncbi:helix-turn-helix domain-containing protein [Bifidobacterium avesanii]|uniref:Helix-turn-helix domain-containing protein n=1 Tax=Bifidobacterium avesanii TaxID=1798157 RepID=A0A7K3TIQ1_9BIFI|nr:helix-turn-helix domain-containing protein [Bifidobacterium avesanii]KAB8290100.1 excisionase [Bifidobacterium avesanii]NEG78951.1 helix-turn-helix domain-containing protein [Bifidobacterium avesanii]